MKSSRTGEGLSTIVNSAHRTSKRREIQRRHAPGIQALPSLMAFLWKERHKHLSSPTRINAMSI